MATLQQQLITRQRPAGLLTADDIPWQSEVEETNVENLDLDAIPDPTVYVISLRDECRWVRRLLHESLALVSKQRLDLQRATRIIAHQRQQLQDRSVVGRKAAA